MNCCIVWKNIYLTFHYQVFHDFLLVGLKIEIFLLYCIVENKRIYFFVIQKVSIFIDNQEIICLNNLSKEVVINIVHNRWEYDFTDSCKAKV